ncbi:MAG: hypothetical protein R2838_13925 [Caldilineaceae bacterium]
MFAQIFSLSSLLVMPFWLLMIALPTGAGPSASPARFGSWRRPRCSTRRWCCRNWPLRQPLLMNPTLDGIAGLLGTPAGATHWLGPLPGLRPLRVAGSI